MATHPTNTGIGDSRIIPSKLCIVLDTARNHFKSGNTANKIIVRHHLIAANSSNAADKQVYLDNGCSI